VRSAHGYYTWPFVGQMMDHRPAPMPYELRQGDTVVRSGTLDGAVFPPIPVTPGRYTLTAKGPSGTFVDQPTSTTVKAAFDTSAADPNPPVLTQFRILAGGQPSKAFCIGERAEIRFRVTDDVQVRRVRLSFRLGAQGFWLPWPLVRDGEDLVAHLPLGWGTSPNLCSGETRAVPIAVKIEAADVQGNSIVTEMTPAYARLLPKTHALPLIVETP